MKFKPWQETRFSSRPPFKVLPSSSPTRSKGYCWVGVAQWECSIRSLLFRWRPHGGSSPADTGVRGKSGRALSHEEACVAIPVQLQDLPKTLFGRRHSFFRTFTFCCLVADRWWVWCRSLGGVEGHRKGSFASGPFWASTAITYLAWPRNQAWTLRVLSIWRAWATAVHRIPTLYLLPDFWWTFLFDAFMAST